jgi:enoyl-CoA hydratase/carnithine racemase
MAAHMATLPPGAMAAAKQLIREGEEEVALAQAVKNEDAVLAKHYGSPENVRVVEAFLASRKKKKG